MRKFRKIESSSRPLGAALRPGALACMLLIVCASVSCRGLRGAASLDAPARFEPMVGQAPGPSATTSTGTLWYQLEVAPHRLTVHIRLLKPPQHTTFFLPAQWAGHADYARAIKIHGAQLPGGPAAYTIDRASGRIEVESKQAKWVQLDYSVALSTRADRFGRFHPRYADKTFFAYGPAFLILPSAQIIDTIRDIPVEIRAPADWKILSTWNARKSAPSKTSPDTTVHGYMAETPAALRDAFVVAGDDLIIQRQEPAEDAAEHSAVTLAFDPGTGIDRASFGRSVSDILGVYRQRFGDLGPVSAYMRQLISEDGQDHLGVGRHAGFVIEMRDSAPAGDDSPAAIDPQISLLLAHEAFHMWNGHSLTPAPESELGTRWFKEGFTHYMALKTLAELGQFSREEVLAELATAADHYLRNPAARPASRGSSSAVERARLPYDRGVLLGLAIDTYLTDHSEGRLSVHDWFRALMDNLARRHQPYRAGHLRAAFISTAEQAGASAGEAGEFWRAHVETALPLHPETLFKRAGLHWLNSPQQKQRRLLRLNVPNSPFERLFPADPTAHPTEPHVH